MMFAYRILVICNWRFSIWIWGRQPIHVGITDPMLTIGSFRRWRRRILTNPSGRSWRWLMHQDRGFVRRSRGGLQWWRGDPSWRFGKQKQITMSWALCWGSWGRCSWWCWRVVHLVLCNKTTEMGSQSNHGWVLCVGSSGLAGCGRAVVGCGLWVVASCEWGRLFASWLMWLDCFKNVLFASFNATHSHLYV